MRALERAGYLAHAQSAAFQRRLERARATIAWAMEHCGTGYVAWSAGKDSSAMLWLVAEADPRAHVRILCGGETRLLYASLDSIIAWWQERWPELDLQEIFVDRVFAEGWQDAGWLEQHLTMLGEWDKFMGRRTGIEGLRTLYLGLRAEESPQRRLALKLRVDGCPYAIHQYSQSRHSSSRGLYRVAPLDAWRTADVAALHVLHDIPLLETYHTEGMEARTHLRAGRRSVIFGQIAELKRRDPQNYNRLTQRFPELARWT